MLNTFAIHILCCAGPKFSCQAFFHFRFHFRNYNSELESNYSQNVFGTFFIQNLLALPLQMVEFQQSSNIFSFISGNLQPAHCTCTSNGCSTCVSISVCKIVRFCVCVLNCAQSGQRSTEKRRQKKRKKQATMSIWSINLLPKWVIEIHFHGEQKNLIQVRATK